MFDNIPADEIGGLLYSHPGRNMESEIAQLYESRALAIQGDSGYKQQNKIVLREALRKVSSDPNNVEARIVFAAAHFDMGNYDTGMSALNSARTGLLYRERHFGNYPILVQNVGQFLIIGDLGSAKRSLKSAQNYAGKVKELDRLADLWQTEDFSEFDPENPDLEAAEIYVKMAKKSNVWEKPRMYLQASEKYLGGGDPEKAISFAKKLVPGPEMIQKVPDHFTIGAYQIIGEAGIQMGAFEGFGKTIRSAKSKLEEMKEDRNIHYLDQIRKLEAQVVKLRNRILNKDASLLIPFLARKKFTSAKIR